MTTTTSHTTPDTRLIASSGAAEGELRTGSSGPATRRVSVRFSEINCKCPFSYNHAHLSLSGICFGTSHFLE